MFKICSSASIADFEQVNVCWTAFLIQRTEVAPLRSALIKRC